MQQIQLSEDHKQSEMSSLAQSDLEYLRRGSITQTPKKQIQDPPVIDLSINKHTDHHDKNTSDIRRNEEKKQQKEESVKSIPKLVFATKGKETNLSPFNPSIPYTNNTTITKKIAPKNQKVYSETLQFKRQSPQQLFYYLKVQPQFLDKIRKNYLQFIAKLNKIGPQMAGQQFHPQLPLNPINLAPTTNMSILRTILLNKEWLQHSNKNVKIWTSLVNIQQFTEYLKKQIQKETPKKLMNIHFIPVDQLKQDYTIAHLQHKFSKLFFLLQIRKDKQGILEGIPDQCDVCLAKGTPLCLCLGPPLCASCISSDQSILHTQSCLYATIFPLKCQSMQLQPYPKLGLIGLKNPRNLCYLNTALQCLLSITPLTTYFLTRQYFRDINISNYRGSFGELTARYAEIVSQAWCQQNNVFDGVKFKTSLAKFHNSYLNELEQQDSHECFSKIINYLRQDLNSSHPPKPPMQEEHPQTGQNDRQGVLSAWNKLLSRNCSIIEDLFTNMMKSTLECTRCQHTSITFEPSLEIPLQVIPPQQKCVQRKPQYCCFIHQNTKKKNQYICLELQKQTLEEMERRIRHKLQIKSHRKIVFYILSTHGIIERITSKSNLTKLLGNLQLQKQVLACLEYTQEELSAKYFQVTLTFQTQNVRLGTYENVSYKRPLFFNKINRPKRSRQIITRILLYLFPRIYMNVHGLSRQAYIDQFLNSPNLPFKLFIASEHTNGEPIEIIDGAEEIRLPVVGTEVIARFSQFSPFQIKSLWTTIREEKGKNENMSKYNRKVVVNENASLTDCIKKMSQPQVLTGWKCPKCQNSQMRTFKTLQLCSVSDVIVFYFKRFAPSSSKALVGEPNTQKLTDFISFPLVLNMQPFLSLKCQYNRNREYRLKSVANHYKYDKDSKGHYTAFVQHQHFWYICNDQTIREMNSGDVCTENAYYLVYQRIQ